MNSTKEHHIKIAKLAARSAGNLIAVNIDDMPKAAMMGLESHCEACAFHCCENGCTRSSADKETYKCHDGIVWRQKNGARNAWGK